MCESILKILSTFTFFSDITYETLLCRGSFEKKKHFYFDADFLFLSNSEPDEPLVAALGIVGCGGPGRVPTWVERAENNPVLKKIEWTFWKC